MHRHATDIVALISGTVFAGFTVIWALTESEAIDVKDAWLAGPGILILAGIVGLVVALTPSRERPPAYVEARPDEPTAYDVAPYPRGDEATVVVADDEPEYEPDDEPTDVVSRDDEPAVTSADDEPTTVVEDDEPTAVLPDDEDDDRRS
jgi:hypothetical protein